MDRLDDVLWIIEDTAAILGWLGALVFMLTSIVSSLANSRRTDVFHANPKWTQPCLNMLWWGMLVQLACKVLSFANYVFVRA